MEKINLNNISLSYETSGKGSDVLLLHGFPSSMYMWNAIKKELIENGYRVTIVEQRGYPLSRLDNFDVLSFNIEELSKDIEELIIKLNLDQNLTIVGHDWGSIVAWAVTSREIIDINKKLGCSIPEGADYHTLAGFLLEKFQKVPKIGDILDFDNSKFEVTSMSGPKIDRVKIILPKS